MQQRADPAGRALTGLGGASGFQKAVGQSVGQAEFFKNLPAYPSQRLEITRAELARLLLQHQRMRIGFAIASLLVVTVAGCHEDGLGFTDQYNRTDASVDGHASGSCAQITLESECRARPDCTVAACTVCSCAPAFVACLGPNDMPPECPIPPCPAFQCCRTSMECQSSYPGGICDTVPSSSNLCGGPTCAPPGPSTCSVDADCNQSDPTQICEYGRCSCDGLFKSCKRGCTSDASCPEPQACGADHRCHDRPCDVQCTGNYACDASGKVCARKRCSVDADCGSAGFCVEQKCSKGLGQCGPSPM